jgi:hypothetical protein
MPGGTTRSVCLSFVGWNEYGCNSQAATLSS